MKKLFLYFLLLLCLGQSLFAQSNFTITLISEDAEAGSNLFIDDIQKEINALLSTRQKINYNVLYSDNNIAKIKSNIELAYRSNSKVIIGTGFNVCNFITQKISYNIPTIVTFVLDNELQNVPITPKGTSGIPNFSYIQSPFDIARDFKTLFNIIPYKKIAIIGESNVDVSGFDFNSFFNKQLIEEQAEQVFIPVNGNVQKILNSIPNDVEAAYILPIFIGLSPSEQQQLLNGLAEKKLPTMALLNKPYLELGAYAAYTSDDNLKKIPRRVALNVLKLSEGEQAAHLPVKMSNFTESLQINMNTVKRTKIYPNWDILSAATLTNVNEVNTDRTLSLKLAIAEALENNLGYKITQKETQIAEKEIDVAKSNYLPQVDATMSGVLLDENTVQRSFGTQGYFNWSANASFTQLILSEPALANVAIQQLLYQNQQQNQKQTELDIIQQVSQAFLGMLQTRELVKLRNQNVAVTKKNYDIALAKEKVGYSGNSDVYRWESELALDNIDLNNAQASYRQAGFNINQILNRPIKEEFKIENLGLSDTLLMVLDQRLINFINNPGDVEKFADFLVQEAFENLPEIKQIEAAIKSQERSILSQDRAFYLPTVAVSGQYDIPIANWGFPENVQKAENKNTWNLGLAVQMPIFQGNSRKHRLEQAKISLLQVEEQMTDLRNKLELQIRANMETAVASYGNLGLAQDAAKASAKNFEIAQQSYEQGLMNITTLIDAQNAKLGAEINATNSIYQFILDFLAVERAIGRYHFLSTPSNQDAFFQRFVQFHN